VTDSSKKWRKKGKKVELTMGGGRWKKKKNRVKAFANEVRRRGTGKEIEKRK